MFKLILLTRVVTVTVHFAFLLLPSVEDTVIVAVPLPVAVTVPSLITVATDVLDEDQVRFLLLVVDGETVAIKTELFPVCNASVVLFKVILLTRVVTVTVQLAFFPLPSVADTVIVASPLPLAVTTPLVLTVATDVSDDVHVRALLLAVDGKTVAVKT